MWKIYAASGYLFTDIWSWQSFVSSYYVLTVFSHWIHKMKYSCYQRILLLFVAGLFIGLRRLTKSNRESSFSKLSLLHLAGCVSSPGSLSNLITMWRHNMVAISKVGNFRTRLSLSEILSDPIRCKLVRYQWFCSNHCFCWLQRDTTKSYWNSK